MALVRNNRSAEISLPAGKILVTFKPGTHEYPNELLDKLDTARASVRSYFEPATPGAQPSLEVDPDDTAKADPPTETPPPTAAELVAEIRTSDDVERLRRLAEEDDRVTVSKAAKLRLDQILEAAGGGDDDEGAGDGDE